jgi:Cell wall-active antibiotics response 4TMS YvqF
MDVQPLGVPSPNPVVPVGPVMVPAESVPQRQGVVACMGRATREKRWTLPRVFRAVAIMGEVVVDLSQVEIGPGISHIETLTVMGKVRIIIPHNLHVEVEGHSVMGEFKVKRPTDAIPSPEAPTVVVSGTAFMGEVQVRVVDPAAPTNWRDQWRAAREAKRLARAQERRR